MDPLSTFRERFGAPRALIGMLHVGALPGTPAARHSIAELIERTVAEARIYRDAGFTALALENMHDRPYLKGRVGPEVTASHSESGSIISKLAASRLSPPKTTGSAS
jgi:hypothetical protein